MRRGALLLYGAIMVSGAGVLAQTPAPRVALPVRAAAPAATAHAADEKAIAALVETFVKAFNAGDADAVAATYSETAVTVDEEGHRAVGRAAVKDEYAAAFANDPGCKIAIQVGSLHFISADTALEQGRSIITPPPGAGAPEITKFTTVYVKQGGKWLQGAVKDEHAHDLTPHDRLKELEWLIGDWVNESQDAVVSTSCHWDKSGNFIEREFSMKTAGRPVLNGTQRIGWDPLKHQYKTWVFDSEGGHGEGYFTRTGNEWVVKVEGVNQDGKPITATNIITRLGKDRMSWQSTARTVGGAAVPGIDEFVIVRKPPEIGK